MKKLIITVSGEFGAGKTTLARLILAALQNAGFDPRLAEDEDFEPRGPEVQRKAVVTLCERCAAGELQVEVRTQALAAQPRDKEESDVAADNCDKLVKWADELSKRDG